MLFGDKFYKKGEFASEEVTNNVKRLTRGIVNPDKLTVMSCKTKPYATHQEWMRKLLHSNNGKQSDPIYDPEKDIVKGRVVKELGKRSEAIYDPKKGHLRYKADIVYGRVVEELVCDPPGWRPEKSMLMDVLARNNKEDKATLEFWENKDGQINPVILSKGKKGFGLPFLPSLPSLPYLTSHPSHPFCGKKEGKKPEGGADFA